MSERKIALLFSGGGTQYVGMTTEVSAINFAAKSVHITALKQLDSLTYARAFLTSYQIANFSGHPEYSHLAVYVTNHALFQALTDRLPHLKFHATAGRGLGEYNAVVASGALRFEDALAIVQERGKLISDVSKRSQSDLTIIVSSKGKDLTTRIRELKALGLYVAIVNTPHQLVVTGYQEEMRPLIEHIYPGCIRIIKVPCKASVHTPEMRGTEDKLEKAMRYVRFNQARVPVVANTSATFIQSPRDIKRELLSQPYKPVDLVESVRRMQEEGINMFIDIGPTSLMGKLIQQIDPNAELLVVKDGLSLEHTVAVLSGKIGVFPRGQTNPTFIDTPSSY